MKHLRKITEEEMVAVFLRAEVNSVRFGKRIVEKLKEDKVGRSIIDRPNLNDKLENTYRAALLQSYRGYKRQKALFENFPTDIQWWRIALSRTDLEQVRYINYPYWVELSGGSRLAKDAAENIRRGIEIFSQSNKSFFEAAIALTKGVKFPEMILVAANKDSSAVVLEGHLRLTAYFLEPEYIPNKTEAIVGYSEGIRKWELY